MYFGNFQGQRTAFIVFDIPDSSNMVAFSEPFFQELSSRHHAELRRSPTGSYEIVDLGSHNGTFVNGERVSQAMLTEHDIVRISRSTFRLAEGELWHFVDDSEVS